MNLVNGNNNIEAKAILPLWINNRDDDIAYNWRISQDIDYAELNPGKFVANINSKLGIVIFNISYSTEYMHTELRQMLRYFKHWVLQAFYWILPPRKKCY